MNTVSTYGEWYKDNVDNHNLFIKKASKYTHIDCTFFWCCFYRTLQKCMLMQQKLSVLLLDLLQQGFLPKSPARGRFVPGLLFVMSAILHQLLEVYASFSSLTSFIIYLQLYRKIIPSCSWSLSAKICSR